MHHTYIGGRDFEPGLAMLQVGADYDNKAQDLKRQKAEAEGNGKDGPDLASLGPPFLHAWVRLVQCIGKSEAVAAKLPEDKHNTILDYWNNEVAKLPMVQLERHVKLCRARNINLRDGKTPSIRVQLAVAVGGGGIGGSCGHGRAAQGRARAKGRVGAGSIKISRQGELRAGS